MGGGGMALNFGFEETKIERHNCGKLCLHMG